MVKVTFTHLFVVFQGFKGILNMLNYSRIKTLELYERIFFILDCYSYIVLGPLKVTYTGLVLVDVGRWRELH